MRSLPLLIYNKNTSNLVLLLFRFLDFSRVTKADRKTANTWASMNSGAKHKKKPKEEED
jgi:hypothetical protein